MGWTLSPTRDTTWTWKSSSCRFHGKISTTFFVGRHFLQQHHPQKIPKVFFPNMLHVWCIYQRLVGFYGKLVGKYSVHGASGFYNAKRDTQISTVFPRRSRPKQRAMNPSLSGLPRLENPSGRGRVIGNPRGAWAPTWMLQEVRIIGKG